MGSAPSKETALQWFDAAAKGQLDKVKTLFTKWPILLNGKNEVRVILNSYHI